MTVSDKSKPKPVQPRGRARFRKTELSRAAKAAVGAGLHVARIDIGSEGKISLVMGAKRWRRGCGDSDSRQGCCDGRQA
jgi:hypothetical protein